MSIRVLNSSSVKSVSKSSPLILSGHGRGFDVATGDGPTTELIKSSIVSDDDAAGCDEVVTGTGSRPWKI